MNYVNHSLAVEKAVKVTSRGKARKPPRPLTRVAAAKLYEELKASVVPNGEFVKFVDGVSDASIAAKLGVHVSTVKNYRTEIFGKLQEKHAGNPNIASYHVLGKRVAELEERLARLEADLGVKR